LLSSVFIGFYPCLSVFQRFSGSTHHRRINLEEETTMNRFTAAVAIAALALSTSVGAQTKLKWAHVYETSEPYHTAAIWAAGEIKKRTSGRYEIEVFPASTLGKETDINQGLTLGTVDIIYTGQLFAGRNYGPLDIGGAPYMLRTYV